jgi:hypothetical protein
MKLSVIDSIRKVFFLIFLFSFIVSFFIPSLYKAIIYVEFILLAPITIFLTINYRSIGHLAQVFYLIFCLFLFIFIGVPGSQYGYLASAIIGLVMGAYLIRSQNKTGSVEFFGLIITALLYMLGSLYLFYYNFLVGFSFEQIAQYFVVASINYVSLTVAAFSSIFLVWACYLESNDSFPLKRLKVLRRISFLLSINVLALAIVFSTRSIIFVFIPLMLYSLRPKRPLLMLSGLLLLLIMAFLVLPSFSLLVLELIVPGRENLLDLYESELKGQERSESALTIFREAIPYFSFCYKCSDHLSYSAVANLVALTFPFSLYYVVQTYMFIQKHLLLFLLRSTQQKTLFLIVLMSFINSIIAALFQSDFLSLVSLFFIIGLGNCVNYSIKPKVSS